MHTCTRVHGLPVLQGWYHPQGSWFAHHQGFTPSQMASLEALGPGQLGACMHSVVRFVDQISQSINQSLGQSVDRCVHVCTRFCMCMRTPHPPCGGGPCGRWAPESSVRACMLPFGWFVDRWANQSINRSITWSVGRSVRACIHACVHVHVPSSPVVGCGRRWSGGFVCACMGAFVHSGDRPIQ